MGVKGKADENCVSSPAIGGVMESRVESGERVPTEGEDGSDGPSEFWRMPFQIRQRDTAGQCTHRQEILYKICHMC